MGPIWSPCGRPVRFLLTLMGCLLLSGCASEILFRSSFSQDAVGAPPAPNQRVGTIGVLGTPGKVVIVEAPANPSGGNWAKISRTQGQANPVNVMVCHLTPFRGEGEYSLLAVVFIPKGSGLATVEFATAPLGGQGNFSFFHLDFLETDKVRVNDNNSQVFGSFPRDQMFTLAVTMNITASSATANVQLLGAASGSMENINLVRTGFPISLPRQFGAVKFSMGFNWGGFFDVTEIIVTRKNP
jgi:hypothetical protein